MNKNQNNAEPFPLHYQVICEHCHKTIFFTGQEKGETIQVLCDECTQSMVEPQDDQS